MPYCEDTLLGRTHVETGQAPAGLEAEAVPRGPDRNTEEGREQHARAARRARCPIRPLRMSADIKRRMVPQPCVTRHLSAKETFHERRPGIEVPTVRSLSEGEVS